MKALIIGLLLAVGLQAQALVAKDSNGLVVEIKEKYGGWRVDTVTVVMLYKGYFVLVRRDGSSSWLPASFNSIHIVERLGTRAGSGTGKETAGDSRPLLRLVLCRSVGGVSETHRSAIGGVAGGGGV